MALSEEVKKVVGCCEGCVQENDCPKEIATLPARIRAMEQRNEVLEEIVRELGEHKWHSYYVEGMEEPLRTIDAAKWYELVRRARKVSA